MTRSRLSVVLAARTGLSELRPVLGNLRRQTIASEIELIVVASRSAVTAEEIATLGGFRSVRLVEIDRVVNRGRAAAHGILEAGTPFVALHENHVFPSVDTMERLIEGRDDPAGQDAAVAPCMRAANPETRRSLAMFLVAYGHVAAPGDAEPRAALPFHHAAYRTDTLQAFGHRLPELMADESNLQHALLAQGLTLSVHPSAVSWHINEARWWRSFKDPFIFGMKFGAARTSEWGLPRRLVYALAWPFVAALRLRDLLRLARHATDTRDRIPWLAPMLSLSATAGGLGEVWGYLSPTARVPADFEQHEFHVQGRLAGVTPKAAWVRTLLADYPGGLP